MAIHLYWAQIFLIPAGVMDEVEGICRAYLWIGVALNRRKGLVAWEEVYKPKKKGGVGIL